MTVASVDLPKGTTHLQMAVEVHLATSCQADHPVDPHISGARASEARWGPALGLMPEPLPPRRLGHLLVHCLEQWLATQTQQVGNPTVESAQERQQEPKEPALLTLPGGNKQVNLAHPLHVTTMGLESHTETTRVLKCCAGHCCFGCCCLQPQKGRRIVFAQLWRSHW